jgi:hypothetical protein
MTRHRRNGAPRDPVRVVSYGGGVNSTALLCLAVETGLRPDIIVFSDTGSEMPHTYGYLETMEVWLDKHGLPPLQVIRWIRVQGELRGQFLPLHEWCEQNHTVPSRAFGFSGCTSKWKQQPIDQYIVRHPLVVEAHARGERVERWLGYDYGEARRVSKLAAKTEDPHLWQWRAPLAEARIDRAGCLALLADHGLPDPGKSSCWMCPSMTKRDIDELGRRYPELLDRALQMEARADMRSRKGLGGRLNWGEYVRTRRGQDPDPRPCGCHDGSSEDADEDD